MLSFLLALLLIAPQLKLGIKEITCIYCHNCEPEEYIAEKTFGDGKTTKVHTNIFICKKTQGRMWVGCEDYIIKWVPEKIIRVDSVWTTTLFHGFDHRPFVVRDTVKEMDTTCVERMDEI